MKKKTTIAAPPTYCETCPPASGSLAVYRITATTLDGEVLDWQKVCEDCLPFIFEVGKGAKS